VDKRSLQNYEYVTDNPITALVTLIAFNDDPSHRWYKTATRDPMQLLTWTFEPMEESKNSMCGFNTGDGHWIFCFTCRARPGINVIDTLRDRVLSPQDIATIRRMYRGRTAVEQYRHNNEWLTRTKKYTTLSDHLPLTINMLDIPNQNGPVSCGPSGLSRLVIIARYAPAVETSQDTMITECCKHIYTEQEVYKACEDAAFSSNWKQPDIQSREGDFQDLAYAKLAARLHGVVEPTKVSDGCKDVI
jgi:hypothetical protein